MHIKHIHNIYFFTKIHNNTQNIHIFHEICIVHEIFEKDRTPDSGFAFFHEIFEKDRKPDSEFYIQIIKYIKK